MPRPLLYTYRRCPYAMRARMALLLAQVPFDAFEIVLRDKPAALLQASPKGTVPVLVLPDGGVVDQSWDIVRWALLHPSARAQAQHWWTQADTPADRQLLQVNDTEFKHHLDRYKYPQRFATSHTTGEPTSPDSVKQSHREQALKVLLEPLEQRLMQKPYLSGQTPCAIDIGIFPFVRQFAAVDTQWFAALPIPRVQSWLQGWLDSDLFEACMQKLEPQQIKRYNAFKSGVC